MDHEHTVCVSKIEKHVHEKDLDCKINLYKQPNSFLTISDYSISEITAITSHNSSQYSFLKSHYQLSFSLRGPPLCI
ncbi:hypothetical protein OAJ14_03485 [Polaribacter sp.]|nr:hypothetical protein [Polaribacter sp.]